MCASVFLLCVWVIDTDRCALSALSLSTPLSTDHSLGIYEAQGLIHSQIMWAEHSWTALTSIFPTQPQSPLPPEEKPKKLFIFPPQSMLGSVRATNHLGRQSGSVHTAGLEHDIRPADEMFLQHAVLHARQQTMLLEGLVKPFYEDHIYALRGHLWCITTLINNYNNF